MSVEILSLWVELDKTQVAAEAAVGQGPVTVLRETYKNKKLFTNMFVSIQQQC